MCTHRTIRADFKKTWLRASNSVALVLLWNLGWKASAVLGVVVIHLHTAARRKQGLKLRHTVLCASASDLVAL